MEENKLINFLSKHWAKLILSLLAISCAAVWAERFWGSNKNQNKQDFLIASQIFNQVQKGNFLASESIETAENILKRHPELHPKYDPILALILFSQQKTAQGALYARSLIDRMENQLPDPYKEYAHATLMISEGEYANALNAALVLEEKIANRKEYQNLDAMNIVRLIFLADKLGDAPKKISFWEKLQKHPGYLVIEPVFHEGNLSLADYCH